MKKSPFVLIMLGFLSVVVFFAGCADTLNKPVEGTASGVSENNLPKKEDTGTVTGRAFLKTTKGNVKTAAGQTVRLHRVGIYSDQWLELASNRKVHTAAYDYRVEDYVFMTTTDDDGKFTFTDVPTGEYHLTTEITWFVPVGDSGLMIPQGGRIHKRITVEADKTLDVVLSR